MKLASTYTPEKRANLSLVRGSNLPAFAKRGTHHLAGEGAYHDGPSRPHLYGVNFPTGNRGDTLGQWGEIIGAAASAYAGSEGGGAAPEGGTAPGGPTTGMQQPGSTATAVSPTFQTQISPQISPTFQQTQSSPGAVQAATATQYMPGGMFAEGGSAAAAPPMSPYGPSFPDFGSSGPTKYGGLPVSPLDPVQFTDIRDFPTAGSEIARIRASEPFNWTPVYWAAGIGAVAVVAILVMGKRKR